jgi:predicted lipid-binding transport protein (Tim44 family)
MEQKLSTVPSPAQALQRDAKAFRRAAFAGALAAGAAAFIVGSLTWISEVGGTPNLHEILSNGLGAGLAYGLVIGLTYGFYHAVFPGFLIVTWWLAVRGSTPWRLMRFLDDAYQRSILRQAGADYQFRHESLRDHLAGKYRG